jgi:tyrosinase
MPVRRNVASLSAVERAALVAAIKAMKTRPDPDGVASNVYDKYVLQHSLTMQTPSPPNTDPNVCNMAHRGPSFLPWHREFLRRFESDLGMPVPYWNWTADQASGSPETAPVWGNDLMGPDGTPSADPGIGRPADAVTAGQFAHAPADPGIVPWNTIIDPSVGPASGEPWLTRALGRTPPSVTQMPGLPMLPTPADESGALNVTPYDSAPWDVTSGDTSQPSPPVRTPSFRSFLEGWYGPGLHNAAHMWVGGSMMPPTSPNDPVFFLHHANVDRIWANWQRKWLNSGLGNYLPVSGGPTGHNLTDGMFPWGAPFTPQSVLDTFALGYWYDDAPAPGITALTPASGDSTGGATVVIAGAGFMGATAVSFGANPAVTFNVDSDAQVTAQSPAGGGAVDVRITTPIGVSAINAATRFTYSTVTGSAAGAIRSADRASQPNRPPPRRI